MHIGYNKKKLLFILHTSKTHWYGSKPKLVKISSTNCGKQSLRKERSCRYYPFELLRHYARVHGPYRQDNETFFTFADGSPIPTQCLSKCLKMMVKHAGFDPVLYGTHSFCTGRSCDLLKLGLSVETIKKLGRWKSNAVFKYLKY